MPVKLDDSPIKGGRAYLVCNGQLQDYRAVLLELDWVPGKPVSLSHEAADALGSVRAAVSAWSPSKPAPGPPVSGRRFREIRGRHEPPHKEIA